MIVQIKRVFGHDSEADRRFVRHCQEHMADPHGVFDIDVRDNILKTGWHVHFPSGLWEEVFIPKDLKDFL